MIQIKRLIFCICILSAQSLCHANKSFISVNFEKVKDQLFSVESFANLSKNSFSFNDHLDRYNESECRKELVAIGQSLEKPEFWAIQISDAWGKLPSGVSSGSAYDFGAFSQCLHLERDGKHYPTQYCIGILVFDLYDVLPPNVKTRIGILNENGGVIPRSMISNPREEQTLHIGICLPSVCSPAKIGDKIGHIVGSMLTNVTFRISEGACQLSENNTNPLTTADWFSIGLLIAVLCLMILSTFYDVYCTLKQEPKTQSLLAFSVYTNASKLLSYEPPKSRNVMECLHGIRVISTQWVVLAHTYAALIALPSQNPIYYVEFAAKYINMVIVSARISVDTFLVISGLLASYTMLKHLEKTEGRINILMLYVHRYIRITPLLAVTILLNVTLFRFLGDGPIWPGFVKFFSGQCEKFWWSSLLFIQNYVNPGEICLIHTWYLSVDMQLFIVAPFIVLLIHKFKRKAVYWLCLLVLGCVGCTLGTYLLNDFTKAIISNQKQIKTYFPTHIRFSPWLIGICTGFFLYESQKKTIQISWVINILGWVASLTSMMAVTIGAYPLAQWDYRPSDLTFGLYDSLSRIAWASALCYIIFACVNNYGGPINWFLGHPLWQPISRLSYSIYLVHFSVMMFFHASLKHPSYLTGTSAFHMFFGHFVASLLVSIVATLAFESPVIAIEKLIFGKRNVDKKAKYQNGSKLLHQ